MGNKTALILALVCAAIASIIVYRTMKDGFKPKTAVPKTGVIFAKTDIPARSVIKSDQLEIRFIPREAVNKDAVLKNENIAGLTAKSEIIRGEQVNRHRLVYKGDNTELSFLIPEGMRAITIPVNEVLGVAGFIKPGEKVDLIETLEPKNGGEGVSWTLLQDIEVLAVAQDMGYPGKEPKSPQTAAKVGTSVTLAVTPLQAQKIVLSEEKGSIHLTLRPALKEVAQDIPVIKESNLLPNGKSAPVLPAKTPAPKRVIEIISGGKIQFITVYIE